jgi:hypothetical protein
MQLIRMETFNLNQHCESPWIYTHIYSV